MFPFHRRRVRTSVLVVLCGLPIWPTAATADTTSQERAAKLESVLTRLDAAMGKMQHRESFDTDAVIEQVGRDPTKLCAWVRDQTQFVPYRGALRGPRGVLMDRVGSDLDRAQLLAHLVISSGYEVRLFRLALTEAEATQRLNRAAEQSRRPLRSPSGSAPSAECS